MIGNNIAVFLYDFTRRFTAYTDGTTVHIYTLEQRCIVYKKYKLQLYMYAYNLETEEIILKFYNKAFEISCPEYPVYTLL